MAEFFAMNGYGFYIWSSMAMVALLMIIEPLVLRSKYRRSLRSIRREQSLKQKR